MHPTDLSCHQKFEKNSPTGSGNIGARSGKYGKSQSTRSHFTHARGFSRAQSSSHACEITGVSPDEFSVKKRYFFR